MKLCNFFKRKNHQKIHCKLYLYYTFLERGGYKVQEFNVPKILAFFPIFFEGTKNYEKYFLFFKIGLSLNDYEKYCFSSSDLESTSNWRGDLAVSFNMSSFHLKLIKYLYRKQPKKVKTVKLLHVLCFTNFRTFECDVRKSNVKKMTANSMRCRILSSRLDTGSK